MTIIKTDAEGNQLEADVTDFATVIDQATNLQWAINVPGLDGLMDYDSAEAFLHAGENYAGFSDWRLPTPQELFGLVRYDSTDHQLMVDANAYPDTESNWYWTSQDTPWSPTYVYAVYFVQGHVGFLARTSNAYVRLVRTIATSAS